MSLNVINPFQIAARKNSPLILDGAMGSQLQKSGADTSSPLWSASANLTNPDLVLQLHQDYIKAGADIITANTFRTNPAAAASASGKLVKKALSLAKEAAQGSSVFVAGSNAPAEDCYQSERKISNAKLQANHSKHIDLLIDNGADFILNETQSHFDEIKIIVKYCSENSIPWVLSLYTADGKTLLSGEKLSYAAEFISDHAPLALGINCINMDLFSGIGFRYGINGYYLNLGLSEISGGVINRSVSFKRFEGFIRKNIKPGTAFIGTCCGSSPGHTAVLKRIING